MAEIELLLVVSRPKSSYNTDFRQLSINSNKDHVNKIVPGCDVHVPVRLIVYSTWLETRDAETSCQATQQPFVNLCATQSTQPYFDSVYWYHYCVFLRGICIRKALFTAS
jgi:hypothetical protein